MADGPTPSTIAAATPRVPSRAGLLLRNYGPAFALLALTIVAYHGSPRNGFIWDDDEYVVNNVCLRSLDGLWDIWTRPSASSQYYPLVFTTFWLEYRLWGVDPTGYHIVNFLLHAIGSILVWRILRLLGIPGAWFAAAVFAVHPVHVESVAWITERKNTLSGVLFFGSMLVYLRMRGIYTPAGSEPARFPIRTYLLSLALFVGALMSKTATVAMPAALLVVTWWRTGRVPGRDVRWLAPFFAVAIAAGLVTVAVETHVVGTSGPGFDDSPAEKLIIAGRAVWFYARTLVWPTEQLFVYPRWTIDARSVADWLYPITAAGLVVTLALLSRRIGRGPLAAVLFFGGMLVPALGFFDIYFTLFSYVADHFQYLPSIGLIALLSALGASAIGRAGRARMFLGPAAAALVLAALTIQTWRAIPKYRDLESLWRDTIARNPDAWMAHFGLGAVYERNNQPDDAARCYEAALRIHPCHVKSLANLAGYHADNGRLDAATELLTRALKCEPTSGPTHANLGVIYGRLNRHEDAVAMFARALELNPSLDEIRVNYALAQLATDRRDAAIEQLRLLLTRRRDLAEQVESNSNLPLLDVFASACAAERDYARAARVARRAALFASQSGRDDLARAMRDRAQQYDRHAGASPSPAPSRSQRP